MFARSFNGWAVSAVDSLDTMMLMGLDDLVSILIPHVANLRLFEKPAIVVVGMHAPDMPHYVPFFETTIRYLGGLLSAYAMSGDSVLLARADDLGRALLPAFNTTSGLPAFAVDVTTSANCVPSRRLLMLYLVGTREVVGWAPWSSFRR
jgi:hypothetical protein